MPLTDARIDEIMTPLTQNVPYSWRKFARAIEAEVCRAQNAESAPQEGLPLTDATQQEAPCPKCDELEPVAIRIFDGEGGYDYWNVEDNENYVADWNRRNPNYAGWVEYLVLKSDAAATIGVITQERDALQAKVAEQAALIEKCEKALTDNSETWDALDRRKQALAAIAAQKGGAA